MIGGCIIILPFEILNQHKQVDNAAQVLYRAKYKDQSVPVLQDRITGDFCQSKDKVKSPVGGSTEQILMFIYGQPFTLHLGATLFISLIKCA